MNIYKISQNVNKDYDSYDSAVVFAENEEQAKRIHPDRDYRWKDDGWVGRDGDKTIATWSWADITDVKVEYLGIAHRDIIDPSVIVASCNAG